MELTGLDAERPATSMGLRPFTSLQAQRKVVFLLRSKHTAMSASFAAKDDASRRDGWRRSHRRHKAEPASEEKSQSKYLITTGDVDNPKPSVLPPQQSSEPHSPASKPKLRLDRQLRRVSIVSFDPTQLSAAVADIAAPKKDSGASKTDKMHRVSAFGLYSIREIMAVIRLFWFLDADRSGGVTLEEIRRHEGFFSGLGYDDVATVFGEMDRDGNGVVTLRELLRLCFARAKPHQLDAMVTLAKVGNIEEYLAGHDASPSERVASADAIAQRRLELLEIFRLFDRNGDGKVSMQELLQALHVDEQEQPWAVGAVSSRTWSNAAASAAAVNRARSGSLTKDDVVRFYHEYDKNGDAELDFDEFLKLMESSFGAAAHRPPHTAAARSSG
ncbi:hypothetical protein PINS_up016043 [Pythium insidiosum]|nr:hypothetical protein PINS_up016043 [Pythium insidiosum]